MCVCVTQENAIKGQHHPEMHGLGSAVTTIQTQGTGGRNNRCMRKEPQETSGERRACSNQRIQERKLIDENFFIGVFISSRTKSWRTCVIPVCYARRGLIPQSVNTPQRNAYPVKHEFTSEIRELRCGVSRAEWMAVAQTTSLSSWA